ncbi:MAG TPA: formate dehydrogenase subunit gamma [Noviherbaspirillum sp.]|nr:formate dehydrogenase subunit gamma [Noviherbaspirillum sp.]
MKGKRFFDIALGVSALALATGIALAQNAPTPPAAPQEKAVPQQQQAPQVAPEQPRTQQLPNVESVDILKQNQAERTRDQPGNNSPTWRIVKRGENNYASLPYPEAGVLIQPKAQFLGQDRATTAGEAWRQYRNGPLTQIIGWLIAIVFLAFAVIYLIKGPIRLKEPRTGRLIERYTPFERMTHWTVAISFVTLAITGLLMLFGKYVLMPVFGRTLFGWLTYVGKNIHNFVGPLFLVSLVVMIVLFIRSNLPEKSDLAWIKNMGGMVGNKHASAGRFNAGQKAWFWGGVVVLGLIAVGSGLVLDKLVPGIAYTRGTMQLANVIHLCSAGVLAAVSLGHIYVGTIGMEDAYKSMRTGYVDDTWAKEHHDLWYEKVERGEIPRIRSPEGAEKIGGPARAV